MTVRWESSQGKHYGVEEGHQEHFATVWLDPETGDWRWLHWTGRAGQQSSLEAARGMVEWFEAREQVLRGKVFA